MALATFAMITANGGMASATAETMTEASTEYRSISAQDSTNNPMQVAISAKYQRLSEREGCGPAGSFGSMSLPVMGRACPAARLAKHPGPAGAAHGLAGVWLAMLRAAAWADGSDGRICEGRSARDRATAAPLAPLLPAVGSLATRVDAALGSLRDG